MKVPVGWLRLFVRVLAVVLLLLAPWIVWQRTPARTLRVLVLDKTVPNDSYREHRGLMWLLNHRKYVQADGRPYELDRDYYGFFPKRTGGSGPRARSRLGWRMASRSVLTPPTLPGRASGPASGSGCPSWSKKASQPSTTSGTSSGPGRFSCW